jgi:succinyl-diaminopimelate desuccinylase
VIPLLPWVERFIATPSISRDGNHAIAACAAELAAEIGGRARSHDLEIDGVTHSNVIADFGSGTGDGLLLLTHLDTVPPGDTAAWTATGGDPFRPSADGDTLFGLGSADAKVDFVCKALALATIPQDTFRGKVRLVGTFGEEIGLLGVRELVRSGGAAGFRFALVGEPTELACVIAHKGYAAARARVFLPSAANETPRPAERIAFTGRSAHSSTPRLGQNAIETCLERLAADDVRGVRAIAGGGARNQVPDACVLEFNGEGAFDHRPLIEFHRAWRGWLPTLATPSDDRFDPPTTVGSLNLVSLENAEAVFTFDLRPLPGIDPDRLLHPLRRVARVEVIHTDPPLSTPRDSPLVQAVLRAQEALGLPARTATKAACTEAGVLAAHGVETVVLGAGRATGNIHRPNEHTSLSQLAAARDLYAKVIRDLCA